MRVRGNPSPSADNSCIQHLAPPALPVDTDHHRLRKAQICCHQYQPVLPVITVADEDDTHRKRFVPLAYGSFYRQQILRTPAQFPVAPVDCLHILHHAFMKVVELFRLLCHPNHLVAACIDRQKRGRRAKPRIEQDVTRRNRRLLRLLQKPQHHLGCFHLRQLPLLCTVGTSIYLPGGSTKKVLRIPAGKKRMTDGKERISIRPAKCEHTESVGELLFGMVVKAC